MDARELAKAQAEVTKYGEHFDADCDNYLPDEPTRLKRGRPKKDETGVFNHSKRWWQAQCAFRGLKTDGTVADLHERMRTRDKSEDLAIGQQQEALWASIKQALHTEPDQEPSSSSTMPPKKQTARRGRPRASAGRSTRQVAEHDEADLMDDMSDQ